MKYCCYVLSLVFCNTLPLFAQGEWVWAKRANGEGSVGTSTCADKYGNVLVTGYTTGTTLTLGSITLTNAGAFDIFVAKYDSLGNILWAKSFGGNDVEQGYAIATDRDGNIFIAGTLASGSVSFGNTTLNNPDVNSNFQTAKFFIAKLDQDGNVLWAKSASGTNYAEGHHIAIDTVGNIYVSGFSNGAMLNFDQIAISFSGSSNTFIVKYNPDGNVLWANSLLGDTFGTQGYHGTNITTDLLGHVYLSGSFISSTLTIGNVVLENQSTLQQQFVDIFLAKLDGSGNILWAKSMGGNRMEMSSGITTDQSGNVYMTGSFLSETLSFGNFVLRNPMTPIGNTFDLFIAKFDSEGNPLWAKSASGPSSDEVFGISVNNFGIFITGTLWNATTSDTLNFGNNIKLLLTTSGGTEEDIFVAQYDSSGTAHWAYRSDSQCNNVGFSIASDLNGDVLVTGVVGRPNNNYFPTPIYFGDHEVQTTPTGGMYIAKFKPCRPLVVAMNDSVEICFGKSIVLTSTSSTGNQWSTGEVTQSIEVTLAGRYSVAIFNSIGCLIRYEKTSVIIDSLPKVSITYTALIFCEGTHVTLTSTDAATYLWNSGATSQALSVSVPGTYNVTITDANGCSANSESIEINLYDPLPDVLIQSDCDRIFLSNNQPVAWFRNNEFLPELDSALREFYPLDSGHYHVEINNACESTKSNTIRFIPPDLNFIFMPNVITPNGDAFNEFFELDEKLKGSTLLIINRWGKEVYYSDSYLDNWNGSDLASGTYYYLIRNACFKETLKGFLAIIR